jgi:hypothetical protein
MIASVIADTVERKLHEAATLLREAASLVQESETFPAGGLQRICTAEVQVSNGLVAVQNAIDNFKGVA